MNYCHAESRRGCTLSMKDELTSGFTWGQLLHESDGYYRQDKATYQVEDLVKIAQDAKSKGKGGKGGGAGGKGKGPRQKR